MVLGILLAAGALGLASYGLGKRRERHEIANGYVTYHDYGQTSSPAYGHIHYGRTGQQHHHQSQYQRSHVTGR
jgi:hypothetical protein